MWLICILLAAISNAVQDTLTHHFGVSVFRKKNKEFWNPIYSWERKYYTKWPDFISDAFHISKTLTGTFLIAAIFVYARFGGIWSSMIADVASTVGVWVLVFNLFYNKFLLHKGPL